MAIEVQNPETRCRVVRVRAWRNWREFPYWLAGHRRDPRLDRISRRDPRALPARLGPDHPRTAHHDRDDDLRVRDRARHRPRRRTRSHLAQRRHAQPRDLLHRVRARRADPRAHLHDRVHGRADRVGRARLRQQQRVVPVARDRRARVDLRRVSRRSVPRRHRVDPEGSDGSRARRSACRTARRCAR